MEPYTFVVISLAGFLGAFMGVMTGGGSLISLPAMMMFLPPHVAIATNRFGIIFATLGGTASYHKRGVFEWRIALPLAAMSLLGGLVGSNLMLAVDEALLKRLVAILIILVAVFFALSNKGLKPLKNPSKKLPYLLVFFGGIYSGFFGPGTGTFYMAILILFFGLDFIHAAGTKSFLTLTSSIAATAVFAYYGVIEYSLGIALGASMVIGGWLGAKTAVKKGNAFVRTVFLAVSVILAASLLI